MSRQAYGTWESTLNEHIVRAVTTRLAYLDSEAEGDRALQYEKSKGFIYIDGLLEKLIEYEENRADYLNFVEFYPTLLQGLDQYND